jgi:hypothetical protein
MEFSELARAASTSAAQWVKLRNKADGTIEGNVVEVEKRPRTDMDGNVVNVRGKDTPRIEWIVTLTVPLAERENLDDQGTRKFSCNESMQRAISNAVDASQKASGELAKQGDTLKIAVSKDPETEFSQAEYIARWTASKPIIDISEF